MNKVFADRFADRPVMISVGHEKWAEQCLAGIERSQSSFMQQMGNEPVEYMADDDFWPKPDSWMTNYRPYVVKDGTLSVPIKGLLLHDFGYSFGSWATGYVYIRKAIERGMADPFVKRIALMVNSGGGEVAGNFDLNDWIYSQRGKKPMKAFVDEHAYSAAFSLATCADSIDLPRSGGVGSVGVVTSHMDISKHMDEWGVKITFIHAGSHKVDGNPYEPLPSDVKDRIQVRIDGLYDIFVSTVARNLGIQENVVRDTEALTLSADEAIEIGFATEIVAIEDALAGFSGLSATPGEIVMSEKPETTTTAQVDQVALDNARAEGRNEGATAERERIQAILGCDEAKSRSEMAQHLAMNTDLTVDAAKGILNASPEAKAPEAQVSAFEQAMANNNPEITAEGDQAEADVDPSAQLIKDYKQAIGA